MNSYYKAASTFVLLCTVAVFQVQATAELLDVVDAHRGAGVITVQEHVAHAFQSVNEKVCQTIEKWCDHADEHDGIMFPAVLPVIARVVPVAAKIDEYYSAPAETDYVKGALVGGAIGGARSVFNILTHQGMQSKGLNAAVTFIARRTAGGAALCVVATPLWLAIRERMERE